MYSLFLPCALGCETFLAAEVAQLCPQRSLRNTLAGLAVEGSWTDVMRLNLHSRVAQRVLIRVGQGSYRQEDDIYALAQGVAWEDWMGPEQTLRIDVSARKSPLKSIQFAALRVKDALCDRFRAKVGTRPSVDTRFPQVRIFVHLEESICHLYIDSSGAALFKRGWRHEQGDAPLKETLAASMLYAIDWPARAAAGTPLYDPCCGSGTLVIEAVQMALRKAAGLHRGFGFEQLRPFVRKDWLALRDQAKAQEQVLKPEQLRVFGSDIAFRMVDFARQNAERAGVAAHLQLRGGDALERMPPCAEAGVLLVNPPYGDRINVAGKAGQSHRSGRERPQALVVAQAQSQGRGQVHGQEQTAGASAEDAIFFQKLGQHWKHHFDGWQAWVLSPDMKLPGKLRMREMRRVPLRNGALDCRLFGFDLGKPTP